LPSNKNLCLAPNPWPLIRFISQRRDLAARNSDGTVGCWLTGEEIHTILKGMEVRDIDIEKVKLFLEEKERRARQKRQAETRHIIDTLQGLVPLWEKYRISRIYLYGSMARARGHNCSDIDIAVQGEIDYLDLLHLFAEVDRHFSRQVDVRRLEDIPFKEEILKTGVLVYEQ
jgi:predicted nucleotidyltransferase